MADPTRYETERLRERAEQRVADGPPTVGPRDSLVHELRVNEAELEIQNHELVQSRLRLEESERRWHAVFDQSPEPYLVVRPDGVVQAANEATERLLGWPDRWIGKVLSRLAEPGDQVALHRLLLQTFGSRQGQRGFLQVRRAPADEVTVEVVTALLDGRAGGNALVVLRDQTERRRADEEKERLTERLERLQRLEALGRMAGAVAHEMNNVLAIVMSSAEDARGRATDREEADVVEEVLRAARRGRDQTQKLLGFARVTPRQQVAFDLSAVAREVAGFVRRLGGGVVEVEESFPLYPVAVSGDPTQVHQALLNLGLNAIDAVGERGGHVRFLVDTVILDASEARVLGAARPGRFARVTVEDDGPGFRPEALRRAFEPFFTTKEAGKGTGLGLAMVWGVARDAGGVTTIESRDGKGATVAVLLPASGEVSLARAAPVEAAPPAAGKVLVVDDEPAIRRSVVRAFQRAGWTAVEAGEGAAALSAFDSSPGDVAVLVVDLHMPGMSGLELVQRLRERDPELPVVLMSGYSEERIPAEVLANRVTAFVGKPFESAELMGAARRVMRRPVLQDPGAGSP
ncbi:MAG: hypothetical protein RJA59_2079 [Pseudomonadota bacterium]